MPQDTWKHADEVRLLDGEEGSLAFDMGDLILEDIPWGQQGVSNGADEEMRAYAEYTGVGYETIRQRRRTSAKVPNVSREMFVSWAAYRAIADQTDERIPALLEAVNHTPAPTKSGRWTVSAVSILIHGPAPKPRVEAPPVQSPPHQRQSTTGSGGRPDISRSPAADREVLEPRVASSPEERRWRGDQDFGELINVLSKFASDAEFLLPKLVEPPEEVLAARARHHIARFRAVLDKLEAFMEGRRIMADDGDGDGKIVQFKSRKLS